MSKNRFSPSISSSPRYVYRDYPARAKEFKYFRQNAEYVEAIQDTIEEAAGTIRDAMKERAPRFNERGSSKPAKPMTKQELELHKTTMGVIWCLVFPPLIFYVMYLMYQERKARLVRKPLDDYSPLIK